MAKGLCLQIKSALLQLLSDYFISGNLEVLFYSFVSIFILVDGFCLCHAKLNLRHSFRDVHCPN